MIEDQFEDKYDMMNKNSKAKEKQIKENNDRLLKAKGNQGGGNSNCDNEGIEGLDALSDSGLMGEDYTISGLTAVGSNCKDVTGQIRITIDGPSSPPAEHNNESQPFTFQPDEAGTWTIQAAATGQFSSKTVTVAGVEACENCDNQNQYSVRDGDQGVIDATVFTAPSKTISSVLWEDVPTGDDGDMVNLFNSTSGIDVSFTAPSNTGGPDIYNMTLTATFTDLTTAVDWTLVRVTN